MATTEPRIAKLDIFAEATGSPSPRRGGRRTFTQDRLREPMAGIEFREPAASIGKVSAAKGRSTW